MTNLKHQNTDLFQVPLAVSQYTEGRVETYFHKNYEWLLCLSGRAEVRVNDQTFSLAEGDSILVGCYQAHGFSVFDGGCLWTVSFSSSYVKSFHMLFSSHEGRTAVFRLSGAVLGMVREKMIEPSREKGAYFDNLTAERELTVKGCLYAVCGEYVSHAPLETTETNTKKIAFEVIRYISENFREPISLQTAADSLRYNYYYLSKIFNQNVGYGFSNILNWYRLEYAVELLMKSDVPITQISYESGFQSQRTFNRIFEETYGVSPREYRKRSRNEGDGGAVKVIRP